MTNRTVLNLTRYLQIKKDKEELSFIAPKIKAEIEKAYENIMIFLKNAKPFIEEYCKLYQEYCHMNPNNIISYNNSLEANSFNSKNYNAVATECIKNIILISKNIKENEEDIRKLCKSHNTLVLMLNVKNNLIDNTISVFSKDINKRIEKNQLELEKETDDQLSLLFEALKNEDKDQAKKLIMEDNNSIYQEGNIVYGAKQSSISLELNNFLKEYDIPLDVVATPVYLEAKNGKNAVFIRIEDENETSQIIENFVPNLFAGLVSSYAANSFYLAFLEKNNIKNMACAKFCNRIINGCGNSEDSILIDSCLYKVKPRNYHDQFINGIATQTGEIENLVSSLYEEFNRRKQMPQLSGKSVVCFNEENPYEILPYITIIINTFSNLFLENNAKEIYDKIKALIKDGGDYGIFVICIGKDTTIPKEDNLMDFEKFDLSVEFENVIEYKDKKINLLCDETNEKEVLQKWETKCRKFSSMQLETLVKRKDIEILDFNNEKGIITIPIGIANGKVSYFKTSLQGDPNSGVSTIITGKIGSGKTTFIRTLIMSGAYFYSPEQLQFYIIDFKTKEGTADFNCFCQKEIGYIPHVRFLSERSGVEQAFSLLDYIDKITIERTSIWKKYSKYNVQDAVTYRAILNEKIKEEGCNTYPEYYRKKQKDAMPPLPQIYLIVDEANIVFTNENPDLMDNLENLARKIRSYGISLIICGQSNPFTSKITLLGHFENRIALTTREPLVFENTFPNTTPQKYIDSSFSFLGGQQGKAVFQLGSQLHLTNVNTAYIKNDALGVFANKINEKFNDDFYTSWIQNRPGTTAIASADELISLLEDPNSIINNAEEIGTANGNKYNDNVIRLYIGKNSLSSYPYPIVLKEKIRVLKDKQSNTDPHNYCIYGNLITQLKILLNMTLYFAYCQKKEGIDIPVSNLSINYACITERDAYGRVIENNGEKLLIQYEDLVAKSGFNDCIKVNNNTNDILKDFQQCYKIYQERSRGNNFNNQFPYFFCLANADEWISQVQENIEVETPVKLNQEFIDYFTDYCIKKGLYEDKLKKKEDIKKFQVKGEKTFLSFVRFTIQNYGDEDLTKRYNQMNSKNDMKITPSKITEQLKEMLKNGAKFAIYLVVGYSSANEYIDNDSFININKWDNMITDSHFNENICYCKGVEIQLYDYLKSKKWIGFITKIISKTNEAQ